MRPRQDLLPGDRHILPDAEAGPSCCGIEVPADACTVIPGEAELRDLGVYGPLGTG